MSETRSAPKQPDYDKIAYNKLYKLGHRNIISQPASDKYRNNYDLIDWCDNGDDNDDSDDSDDGTS